ncbi:polysaccharide biosynthesis/export family protein [Echinicola marina]|nr:polysaccharide biosynthesis/export family protein [Echinicola marina]
MMGLLMVTLFSSCISNKKITYLQNLEDLPQVPEDELVNYEFPEYRLQFNDILDVKILTPEDFIENGFNMQSDQATQRMQMAQGGSDIYYMTGYSVDKEGFIDLPVIGKVKVMGLTLDETKTTLEQHLHRYVSSDIFVRVKLGGIRFSTLGEFKRPGKYTILQDRMTIFEALAASGDLTNVAKRDEILLIRQYPEGSKLHRLNLNDRNIITSPYYFIQPNDQIYAQPMKVREIGAGENASQSLSLLVSSISAVVLVLNLVLN